MQKIVPSENLTQSSSVKNFDLDVCQELIVRYATVRKNLDKIVING